MDLEQSFIFLFRHCRSRACLQDFTFSLLRVALTEIKGLLDSRGPSKIITNKNEKITLLKTDQFIKNM